VTTKSTPYASKILLVAALLWLLLQVSLFVVASDAIKTCTAEERDSGTCTTKPQQQEQPSKHRSSVWADEIGDKWQQFLQDRIFAQEETFKKQDATVITKNNEGFLSHLFQTENDGPRTTTSETSPFLKLMEYITVLGNDIQKENTEEEKEYVTTTQSNPVLSSLLERVRELNEEDQSSVVSGAEFFKVMQETLKKALNQVKNTFGEIIMNSADASLALSLMYYLAREDSIKNPSWKRRVHRFNPPVSKEMVVELHDALYLSKLSYVDTLDGFREGLAKFQDNSWEMAYGSTDSLPDLPAHFLLIHKKLSPLKKPKQGLESIFNWENEKSELTIAIVIRGTKDLSDAITDALLEPVPYNGGFAHGGILESGKNLAKKYCPKLKELLKHSGRDHLRLTLMGHSLGAAAASIAAMELQGHDWMVVEALGFGCPSLLSRGLSESTKEYITTVVADADIIPRMSGSSIANLLLDVIEYDWTDQALEDIEFTMDKAKDSLPFGHLLPPREAVVDWVKTVLERDFKPKFANLQKRERFPSVLIPPGTCLHFFRDGVGYTGAKTPCSFFSTVDLARTLVDDHLLMPGYHRALITIARDMEGDYNVRVKKNTIHYIFVCLPLIRVNLCIFLV